MYLVSSFNFVLCTCCMKCSGVHRSVHPLNFDLRSNIYLFSSFNFVLCTCSMNCSGQIAFSSTQCFIVHPLNFDL